MTEFLLIRHAETDAVGKKLVGRLPGISLNERGFEQATQVAARLQHVPIRRIVSSPLERARETATKIAERLGQEVLIREAFNEIDFGTWEGRTFAELDELPAWKRYHHFRSGASISGFGGESLLLVQHRMVSALQALRDEFPDDRIAVVSHADPLRTAIAFFIGVCLDLMLRLEISPASVSRLFVGSWDARLLCLNATNDWPGEHEDQAQVRLRKLRGSA